MLRFLSLLTCVAALMPLSVVAEAPSHDAANEAAPWQWLQGEFTNYQHTIHYPEQGLTPTLYKVQLLEHDESGAVTLLSQQFYLFNQQQPMRQRVYQFNERRRGWRQTVYELPGTLKGSVLEHREQWQRLTGCHVDWQQQGDKYVGTTDASRCYFVLSDNDARVGIRSRTQLYADSVKVRDAFEADAEVLAALGMQHVETRYSRMTYYDAQVMYRPDRRDSWRDVMLSEAIHDQGGRVGLIELNSELELRFQFELVRQGESLIFKVFDLARQQYIHEASYQHGVAVINYETDNLQVQLKPRP